MEVLIAFFVFFTLFFVVFAFFSAANEHSPFEPDTMVPIIIVSFVLTIVSVVGHEVLLLVDPTPTTVSSERIVTKEYEDIENIELGVNEVDGLIGAWFYRKGEEEGEGCGSRMPKAMAKRIKAGHNKTSDYAITMQGNKVLSCYRKE